MTKRDLLTHPVRLRIIHAMSGGRSATGSEIRAALADVPKATLYRHLALLTDGGVLEVDSEQRVRGAVERRYRLNRAASVIDPAMAASTSIAEHRRAFAAAAAVLLTEFNAYLDRPDADPTADLVGYRQHSIWLSPDEREQLISDLRDAIVPHMGHEPSAARSRHLLSPILFPARSAEGGPDEARSPARPAAEGPSSDQGRSDPSR
ncbi:MULTISPECIES: helix-turn-helix domain-containing protein [unclassified Microbacterium]|uniref:helix-turn-helix domain-containing protein n=1 Tax=unclassified Microbacterium TaxID=2609290 RepID=UPI00109D06BE|nr:MULTISPECIES: helix-turn-helix domain-containing protein [unclassified Microbacterium]